MSHSPSKALRPNDEILGYTLKYPIGSGGYGEVWAAEAPGGLIKAIKFVYGFHDDDRAQRETKALNRIKQLRHPFLISLERIDIFDGRLVIISELADHCLRERYVEHVEKGEGGIPREQLLSYLSNVADALDYLTGDHSLQHLDIKPENLLLVGSHVKVADFGLVKSVHDINQSMMDGLTPTYAAPELFDGKPSRNSDQYSLAIVYQELLTGTRPFSGTTAAQLASQHVGSRPNLKSLPATDQAVIARALAKDSEKRYPTCRSMIEDLMRRKVKTKRRKIQAGTALETLDTANMTEAFDTTHKIHTEKIVAQSFCSLQTIEAEIEKLSPLEIDPAEASVRPTVFIGIGQSGGKVLARIKGHINSRVGSSYQTPAMRFLYLDSDRRAIYQSTANNSNSGSLDDSETLEMLLRSREEYRSSKKDFSWLSRRWLFNVPRSMQTEGLRPLGRLALADHFDLAYQRISDTIHRAIEPESLAETAEALSLLPADSNPRVFIVASVAGGIGSGASLDVAHAVRTILSEEGIADENIFGVFLHSTAKDVNAQQLAIANTYSFLSEYNHYCLQGYNGDDTIDLPEFDPGSIFRGLYFAHLGEALNEEQYEEKLNEVAQYLFTSTATRCNDFFEKCRQQSQDQSGLMLRTVGFSSAGGGVGGIVKKTVHGLAEKLIEYWKTGNLKEESNINKIAEVCLAESGFDSQRIQTQWMSIERKHWKEGILSQTQSLVHEMLDQIRVRPAQGNDFVFGFFQQLDELTGLADTPSPDSFATKLESHIERIAGTIYNDISAKLLQLINHPGIRVGGALLVSEAVHRLLENYERTLSGHGTQLRDCNIGLRKKIAAIFSGKLKFTEAVADELTQLADQTCVSSFQMVTCQVTIRLVKKIRSQLSQNLQHITELSRQLVLVTESFREACGSSDLMQIESGSGDVVGTQIIKSIHKRFPQMMVDADKAFAQLDLDGFDGLLGLVDDRSAWLRELPRQIKLVCQQLIVNELKRIEIDKIIAEADLTDEELDDWIESQLNNARPPILNCGGGVQFMIGIPEGSQSDQICESITAKSGFTPTVVSGTYGDCIVVNEVQDVPLDHIAITLIDMRTDSAELVQRLHVRNDIEWTSLTQHA